MTQPGDTEAVAPDYEVQAAVLSMFDAGWLEPGPAEQSERSPADAAAVSEFRDFLADRCDWAVGVDGLGHWRLGDDVRSRVLQRTPREDLRAALAGIRRRQDDEVRTLRRDDRLQVLLENFVDGIRTDARDLDREGTAAALSLRAWAGDEGSAGLLPEAADLLRRRDLFELRAQLEQALPDRHFVGRDLLMADVRAFVAAEDEPGFVLRGAGGAGKTTVLAKLLLDHEREGVPFSYLTYDRGSLVEAGPYGLFEEAVRQLALQLPGLASELDALRERTDSAAGVGDMASRVVARRRQLPPDAIDGLRALLADQRRVIVAVDAFEEIERRVRAYEAEIIAFLDLLAESVPGLRVIVASRGDVIWPRARLRRDLAELTRAEAHALLRALVADNGAQVRDDELEGVLGVVGGTPLSIRLAADLLARTRPGPLRLAAVADGNVQGYLYGRVLEHAADRDVRRLAFPGLVVRRIAPDVIEEVLAEPCGLLPMPAEKAQRIFERLAAEATLCQPSPDGDGALVHRADVRAAMLPTVLQDRPVIARMIHERAVEFYRERGGMVARREELYHRLMLGQEAEVLNGRWDPAVGGDLANLAEEFPRSSRIYLARVADLRLTGDERRAALDQDWVELTRAEVVKQLGRDQVPAALSRLRERSGPGGEPLLPILEIEALDRLGRLDEALGLVGAERVRASRRADVRYLEELLLHEARLLERMFRNAEAFELLDELRERYRERRRAWAGLDPAALRPVNLERHTGWVALGPEVAGHLVVLTSLLRIYRRSGDGADKLPGIVEEAVELYAAMPRDVVDALPANLRRDLRGELEPHVESRELLDRSAETARHPSADTSLAAAAARADADIAHGLTYATAGDRYFHGRFAQLRAFTDDSLERLPERLRLADSTRPEDRLGDFTGRRWLEDLVDRNIWNCLAGQRGAYLLVESRDGLGKTAFATYLAFTRGWPAYITRPDATDPRTVRRSLAAQLIARWELTELADSDVLVSNAVTTAFLHEVLVKAAKRRDEREPDHPVVFLVDALDDAPPRGPGELPFGLPPSLPPGTVAVVTCRSGARQGVFGPGQAILARINLDQRSVQNQADLLSHLNRLAARAGRGSTLAGFCRMLAESSNGDWLSALAVLDQLLDERARGGATPNAPARVPASLKDFYQETVLGWQGSTWWEPYGRPLLATLAAAREPVTRTVLAEWAGIPVEQAHRLLTGGGPFRPFVIPLLEGNDTVLTSYTLFHDTLRKYCEEALLDPTEPTADVDHPDQPRKAVRAAHRRIVEALGHRRGPEGYAHRHLAEHAGSCGQLDRLVLDPDFLLETGSARLLRLRGTLTGSLARSAVAALDLAARSWQPGDDVQDRYRWLLASAIKVHNTELARVTRRLMRPGWHPVAGAWWGTSQDQLPGIVDDPVKALVVVPRPDGSAWIVAGGEKGIVRVWDAERPFPQVERPSADRGGPRLAEYPLRMFEGPRGRGEHYLRAPIGALAAVPLADGRCLVAAASADGTVRTWDPEQPRGGPVARFEGHSGGVWALTAVAAPGGVTLVASAGADGIIRLWNPENGLERVTLPDRGRARLGSVRAMAVVAPTTSTGHTLLAAAYGDGVVRLWDLDANSEVEDGFHSSRRNVVGQVEVLAVLPWPDGSARLAAAGYLDRQATQNAGFVDVWNPARLTDPPLEYHERAGGNRPEPRAADGRGEGRLGLENVTALKVLRGRPGETHVLALADKRGSIRIWDPAGEQRAVALKPLPGSEFRELNVVTPGPGRQSAAELDEEVAALVAVPRPDGSSELVSAGSEGTIRLWDPRSSDPIVLLNGHDGAVDCLAAYTRLDGSVQIVSAGSDSSVRLWDRQAMDVLPGRKAHPGPVTELAVIPPRPGFGSMVATAGWRDNAVRLWDVQTGDRLATLTGYSHAPTRLAVLPAADGRHVLASTGNDGVIHLTNLGPVSPALFGASARRQGQHLRRLDASPGLAERAEIILSPLEAHDTAVTAMTVVAGGDRRSLMVTAGGDEPTVRLWDPWGRPQARWSWRTGDRVGALAVASQPGRPRLLACGVGDGSIQVLDLDRGRGRVLRSTSSEGKQIDELAFVPQPGARALLVARGGAGVTVWDPGSGRLLHRLGGDEDYEDALRLAVATYGGDAILATGGSDGTVRLWDPATGRERQRPRADGHNDAVSALAVISRRTGPPVLASGGFWDATICLWDVRTGDLLARLTGHHKERIAVLAAVPGPDGRCVLASAGDDSSLLFWADEPAD
jgi:WD40 repeat protein